MLSHLIEKIDPIILNTIPEKIQTLTRNTFSQKVIKKQEKNLKNEDENIKYSSSREIKSQSIFYAKSKFIKKNFKRNCESLHDDRFVLGIDIRNKGGLNEPVLSKMVMRKNKNNENLSSNTPSFHTKHSYQSSSSTNMDCSFGVIAKQNKEFSFFEEQNEKNSNKKEKKKQIFPKCLFQFINKKQKLFV